MSYHQGGYTTQYYTGGAPYPAQYSTEASVGHASQPHAVHRMMSFDGSDDRQYYERGNPNENYSSYRAHRALYDGSGPQNSTRTQQSLRSPGIISGYQHTYGSPTYAAPVQQHGYNPQAYAQQYASQASSYGQYPTVYQPTSPSLYRSPSTPSYSYSPQAAYANYQQPLSPRLATHQNASNGTYTSYNFRYPGSSPTGYSPTAAPLVTSGTTSSYASVPSSQSPFSTTTVSNDFTPYSASPEPPLHGTSTASITNDILQLSLSQSPDIPPALHLHQEYDTMQRSNTMNSRPLPQPPLDSSYVTSGQDMSSHMNDADIAGKNYTSETQNSTSDLENVGLMMLQKDDEADQDYRLRRNHQVTNMSQTISVPYSDLNDSQASIQSNSDPDGDDFGGPVDVSGLAGGYDPGPLRHYGDAYHTATPIDDNIPINGGDYLGVDLATSGLPRKNSFYAGDESSLTPSNVFPSESNQTVMNSEFYPRPLPPTPTNPVSGFSDLYPFRSASFAAPTPPPRNEITRSKTDAETNSKSSNYISSLADPVVPGPHLPDLPPKRFNPAKLSKENFRKCSEPWALSSLISWLKDLTRDEAELKQQTVVDAIVALFTHKVPTMNMADAETLGDNIVNNMLKEGVLAREVEESFVQFTDLSFSGVVWQMTRRGCYSPLVHEKEISGRCYSHHCMRTLKKVDLHAYTIEEESAADWGMFYKIPPEKCQRDDPEVQLQYSLHEVVCKEESFISQLEILRTLYRDPLSASAILNPKKANAFLREVFGTVDILKTINEEYLLSRLKYRQKEQGPYIVGFSDIFREWIRKAKTVFIEYSASFPNADYLVRREREENMLFRSFLERCRENKMSNRLDIDSYLKAPISRMMRYGLQLQDVHKKMTKMKKDPDETANLSRAIKEIQAVAEECDAKVGERTKVVKLKELSTKLQLRPNMKHIKLNLHHYGREVIFQGDLLRRRTIGFGWVETRAILFDHYLVLAKVISMRGTRREIYDVSKYPIPMDLLVLESTNEDPIAKSSLANFIGGQTNTGVSGLGAAPVASAGSLAADDNILYPFKVKHLGQPEGYLLYASTALSRQDWCEKLISTKTRHAESLYRENIEPFRLRIMADASFAYSEQLNYVRPPMIKGTPLDRAIREVEALSQISVGYPTPVCRAGVNCATVFCQNEILKCAVGTDNGLYISSYTDPRGWSKVESLPRVTQISVSEEFNIFLVLTDKTLVSYHLDSICPADGMAPRNDTHSRAPRKLSKNREVGFFVAGRIQNRSVVVIKRRDGASSNFKVLEPVVYKSNSIRHRFWGSRQSYTDFFRDYDEFYIATECYSLNMFHSSLAVSTSKGFEHLRLDHKWPKTVPSCLEDPQKAQTPVNSIVNVIKDLRPLGMFRLSEIEFLLVYQGCAVYIDKHGELSRTLLVEFDGKPKAACLYGKYLVLINEDFVEIRNAQNGRRRQVIAGKSVTLLDDGGNLSATTGKPMSGSYTHSGSFCNFGSVQRTVKICMQHPENERMQIIFELLENDGQKD